MSDIHEKKREKEMATFAGGCFWCMQSPFDQLRGVLSTTVGYAGGDTLNPTYEEVCSGKTGHIECIQVVYDPNLVNFTQLLDIFWHNIDPTQPNGQFSDHGNQYRTIIFYHDATQKQLAEASKAALGKRFARIYTEILPAKTFYPAENYHQDYYKKNPVRYESFRIACGRDQRLDEIWGDTTKS